MERGQERDHVARPTLPWRTDRHTQCGRAADDVSSVISVDGLEARIQRDGHERTVETRRLVRLRNRVRALAGCRTTINTPGTGQLRTRCYLSGI
jgi:hypothetical protein